MGRRARGHHERRATTSCCRWCGCASATVAGRAGSPAGFGLRRVTPPGAAGARPDGLGALVRASAPALPGALRGARRASLRAGRAGGRRPVRHRRRHADDGRATGDHGAAPCARRPGLPACCWAVRSWRRRPLRSLAVDPTALRGTRAYRPGDPRARGELARHRAHRRAAHQRVRPDVARGRPAAPRRGLSLQGVGGHRPGLMELLCVVAASLASAFARRGYAVGLASNASPAPGSRGAVDLNAAHGALPRCSRPSRGCARSRSGTTAPCCRDELADERRRPTACW